MKKEKGSPSYENYYQYQLRYRREHYRHFNVLFDCRKERDKKILEAMDGYKENKTELMKKLLEQHFAL